MAVSPVTLAAFADGQPRLEGCWQLAVLIFGAEVFRSTCAKRAVAPVAGRRDVRRPGPTLQHAADQFHLLQHLDAAVAAGEVTAAAASHARLEAATATSRLFVSTVAFRVLAQKPQSGGSSAIVSVVTTHSANLCATHASDTHY
jgi:hypothetical protein